MKSRKFYLALVIFSLVGQVAWVMENMYFNVFIYKMFNASAEAISAMVSASAVAATVTTLLVGAFSDKIGKRKLFICGGYLCWGVSILSFALIRMDVINALFPTDPNMNSGGAAPAEERAKFLGDMELFLYSLSGKAVDAETITTEEIIAIKSDISPADKVTADTPPAVLAYGGKDWLVNAIHGEKMSQALTSCGVASRLIIFPNSGHELGHDPECSDNVQATILEFCKEYFD